MLARSAWRRLRRGLGWLRGGLAARLGAARGAVGGWRERQRKRWRRWRKRHGPELLSTYVMPVAVGAPAAARDDVGLVEADADLLTMLRERFPRAVDERKHGILLDRLASPVERCWVIVDGDGVPCGYCHAAVDSVLNARINAMVRLEPRQAYLFDSFVVRERRGRGLHGFSIARRMELLAEEGVEEVVTIISRANARSLASFLPYGPRAVERLLYLPPVNTTLRLPVRAARR